MKNILFVDDEQSVLDGLRNIMRKQRGEWQMKFICGGETALGEIAQNSYDVVITDMRMPKVDGAALLSKVKDLQPRAVRIVLSGQTDLESAMRTVFVAHQFMAKPCEVEVLREVVTRACRLNDLVSSEAVRARAGNVSMLPPAPATYLQLMRVLANPNASIKDVAKVIERDVGLCAKILQLVNSAFFGLPRKVASVQEAAAFLGVSTLRNVCLGIEALKIMGGREPVPGLQEHSLLTAELARRMFPKDRARGDEAFVAGILHDAGFMLSSSEAPAEAAPGDDVGHAALGAYLLGIWGLPHTVMEAVAMHDDPRSVQTATLSLPDAVHAADWLAREALEHSQASAEQAPLDEAALIAKGMPTDMLPALRAAAPELAATIAAQAG